MTLQERIDALPGWPESTVDDPQHGYAMRNAAIARLALLRSWIEGAQCHNGCQSKWNEPCTCSRDALLAATEVPR